MPQPRLSKIPNYIAVLWGLTGITYVFAAAIIRLTPYAQESLGSDLSLFQWALLLLWCAYMIITEGYAGFQKRLAPRVASRLIHLLDKPKLVDMILAPLFCMGYFRAPKKRLIVTWTVTVGIVLLVVLVRHLSQPWRGIVDLGVVLGLTYGLVTIYYCFVRALVDRETIVSAEVK